LRLIENRYMSDVM